MLIINVTQVARVLIDFVKLEKIFGGQLENVLLSFG